MSKQDREVQEVIRHAQYTASARGIRNMMELAKPDLAVTPDMFDRDPWLLNCPNGTLELQTGTLREHRLEDYITKLCPTEYDAGAACPKFLEFLETILPVQADRVYLQRLCGYWLTGDVREQILPIACGSGSNGKSTLVECLMELFGEDYCIEADQSIVIETREKGHSTEKMDLFGRRLAVVRETGEGERFAEAFVKQATGGDTIRGRNPYERTWQFKPTHKVFLVTNHKPRVIATDVAFWRRVKLIEFTVTIPDDRQDKLLPAKLRAEHRGILVWAVRGCLDWQRDGLGEPESVRRATAQYRAAEDVIGQYLAERCVMGAMRAKKADLYRDYREWCKANGCYAATATKFTATLGDRGHNLDSGRRWYEGVGLCDDNAGW